MTHKIYWFTETPVIELSQLLLDGVISAPLPGRGLIGWLQLTFLLLLVVALGMLRLLLDSCTFLNKVLLYFLMPELPVLLFL